MTHHPLPSDSLNEIFQVTRPERSATDWLLCASAAVFAVFSVMPFLHFAMYVDEGVVLQGAVRILRGQLPYRDFFSFYTPGSYYLYALIFKLFGTSYLAARVVLLVYAGLFAAIGYLLGRRIASRAISLFCACLLSIIAMPARFAVLHNWDSTMAALLALYCAVLFLEDTQTIFAFAAGLFAGATLMLEQSKGGGLLLGLSIAAIVLYRRKPEWNIRHLVFAMSGALLPTAAFVAYFASQRALLPMFEGWTWAFSHYSAVNKLPYGWMAWNEVGEVFHSASIAERFALALIVSGPAIVALLPVLLLVVGVLHAGRNVFSPSGPDPFSGFVVLVTSNLFGVWLSTLSTGRPEFFHLVVLAPLFLFAMPLLTDRRVTPLAVMAKYAAVFAVFLLISFAASALLFRSLPARATYSVATRRGVVRSLATDDLERFVLVHVPAGSSMLVYPYNPLYPFLTDTISPTRFDFLQAGMHSEAEFETARQELERARTEVVLFDIRFRDLLLRAWPATPISVLAKDPVGDFIFHEYRVCKVLLSRQDLPFAYMVRKDLPCPRP